MKAKDVPRGKSPTGKLISGLTRKIIRLEEENKKLKRWKTLCIKLKEENDKLKDEVSRLRELVDEYEWTLGIGEEDNGRYR